MGGDHRGNVDYSDWDRKPGLAFFDQPRQQIEVAVTGMEQVGVAEFRQPALNRVEHNFPRSRLSGGETDLSDGDPIPLKLRIFGDGMPFVARHAFVGHRCVEPNPDLKRIAMLRPVPDIREPSQQRPVFYSGEGRRSCLC